MRYSIVLLMAMGMAMGMASCASHKYSYSERIANQTVSFRANPPNAKVTIKGSTVDIDRNLNHSTSGTSGNLALPSLKKKNLKLVVTAPDYESDTINLKRKVRSEALWKSAGLGLFTYFIPLVIDLFRSDFYQLRPDSRSVALDMDYTDAFYRRKLDERGGSENPGDFDTYISSFPDSPFHEEAKKLKTELEFNLALKEGTEVALNRFIASHPDSHILEQAKKAIDEMEEARLAFESVLSQNTVESYAKFLTRYPASIQASAALQGKTKAAYADLVKPRDVSEDDVMEFMSEHLAKSSTEMDGDWVENAISTSIIRYGAALKRKLGSDLENQAEMLNRFTEFESTFKFAIKNFNSEGGYFQVNTKSLKDEIIAQVKAHYFENGQTNQLSGGWGNSIAEYSSLFPEYCQREDHWCLMGLIQGYPNKNGDVVISNTSWVYDYFNNTSERDRMISFRGYQKDGEFVMLQDHSDWMRFTYSNNMLKEFEAKKDGQTVCLLTFKGLTNSDSDIEKADYFSDGKLIYRQGKGPSGDWFGHVIEDGINVTLLNHPTLVSVQSAMETIRGGEPSLADFQMAFQSLDEFERTVPTYEVAILKHIIELRRKAENGVETLETERREAELQEQRESEERKRIRKEEEAKALAATKAEREKARKNMLVIDCIDIVDYDYEGKYVKFLAHYRSSNDIFTYKMNERVRLEYVGGYTNKDVTKYGHPNLRKRGPLRTDLEYGSNGSKARPEERYSIKNESGTYFMRTVTCHDKNIPLMIPWDASVPSITADNVIVEGIVVDANQATNSRGLKWSNDGYVVLVTKISRY